MKLLNLSIEKQFMEIEQSIVTLASNENIQETLVSTNFYKFDSNLYNTYSLFDKSVAKAFASMPRIDNLILVDNDKGYYNKQILSQGLKDLILGDYFYSTIIGYGGRTVFIGGLTNYYGDKIFALVKPVMSTIDKDFGFIGLTIVTYPYTIMSELVDIDIETVVMYAGNNILLTNFDGDIDFAQEFFDTNASDLEDSFYCETSVNGKNIILTRSDANKYNISLLQAFSISDLRKDLLLKQLYITLTVLAAVTLVALLVLYIYRKLNKNIIQISRNSKLGINKINRDEIDYFELKKINDDILSLNLVRNENEKEIMRLTNACETITLDKLQAQINPHFLYNTLTKIKYIAIMNNQDEISGLITSLVKLLRSTINRDGFLISVRDEIEDVSNYIYIQNKIYSGNINFKISIDENIKDVQIPNFILQPLVENSIFHGIHPEEKGGEITISGFAENGGLIFEVIDNGEGISNEKISHILGYNNVSGESFTNLGLASIQQKIQLHYGKEYGLKIYSKKNEGTIIRINLPIVNDDFY